MTTFNLSPRARMWKAARCLQLFSLEDLAVVGTATRTEAAAFLKCLSRRGFVRQEGVERRARRGRPLAKFRLVGTQPASLPLELEDKHHDRTA